MKRVTVKLSLFFIFLICTSSILSFFGSTIFTNSIEDEIRLNQHKIATSMVELSEKTDLNLDEIIRISCTPMYDVSIVEDMNLMGMTSQEQEKVYNKEIVFITHGRFQGTTTILMLEDYIIQISLHSHNNIFKIVGSRVWFTLFLYVMFGALLISLLTRRIVKPIIKLTLATQEVAKGNFDIQIENHSDDEVGQLTENFNKMIRELKNIELLRKDFITSVSHEFKTPIASIQGFAKLLQRGNLSDNEKEEYTNIIVEETKRLSNLSSNILKLSKLENQEIVEKKTRFSLDEQIRKSILILEHQWSKKNIEFDIELDKVQYLGDEELLQQVWINLLGNAIKFSYENGLISISLSKTESFINVTVTDYGIGMNEETMSRIFEKFYQGDRAHSYEGNGLGLPLAKRILDLYGGSVYAESQLEKGTTFIVKLPIY